jgi:DNA-binding transcriptional LysR family regulator
VAVLWLTPRLARFRACTRCHLRLVVNSLAQLSETDFDMGIYFLRDGPPSGWRCAACMTKKCSRLPGLSEGPHAGTAELPQETC